MRHCEGRFFIARGNLLSVVSFINLITTGMPPSLNNPFRSKRRNADDLQCTMPQGIKFLKHQKYAKMLINLATCLSTGSCSSKNSGTSFCLSVMKKVFTRLSTKPLRLKFGSADCSFVLLFF